MTTPAAEALDTPKSLRARLGLSQADLAKRARVGLRTLCQVEAGREVRLGSVRAFAAVLGVTTADLVAAMERRRAQLIAGPLSRKRAHRAARKSA